MANSEDNTRPRCDIRDDFKDSLRIWSGHRVGRRILWHNGSVYMFRVECPYNRARVHVISLRRDAVGVAFRVGVLAHQGGGG